MAGLVGKDYREFMGTLNMESTAKHSKRFLLPRGVNTKVLVFLTTPIGQENKLLLVLILCIYVLIPDSLTHSSKSL